MSSSAQLRKAIKMISRREGIWDRDGDEEEEAEVMAYQLLVGSLLVRDGWVGANDESKQGRVRRHLQVFFGRLESTKFACFLLKGSTENEYPTVAQLFSDFLKRHMYFFDFFKTDFAQNLKRFLYKRYFVIFPCDHPNSQKT